MTLVGVVFVFLALITLALGFVALVTGGIEGLRINSRAMAGLVMVGGVVLLVIAAAIIPDARSDKEEASASATTAAKVTTSAPPTTTPSLVRPPDYTLPSAPKVVPPTTIPPALPTSVAAAPTSSDPRCAPASDDLTYMVSLGFNRADLRLKNALVIERGSITFFGATTVDTTGKKIETSDVWIIKNGTVYTSTGGARNHSIFKKASTAIDIGPDDEAVQALDRCVYNLTR